MGEGDRGDALGDRMKAYERREGDRRAMRGLPLVARVDGRSFGAFTRGMARPYDPAMADLMVEVARYLVEQTHARVAYTQSDEISLVLEPFDLVGTGEVERALNGVVSLLESGDARGAEAGAQALLDRAKRSGAASRGDADFMFGGRFQKLCSVVAGLATARFVRDAVRLWPERCERRLPVFDCRVFEVPSREEAVNALLWRELDAAKNAVSMAARAHFPHSRLQGKSSAEMQEMLFRERGVNFNDYPARFKRGVFVQRKTVFRPLSPEQLARIPEGKRPAGPVPRTEILCLDLPPIARVANRVEVLLDGGEPMRRAGESGRPATGVAGP